MSINHVTLVGNLTRDAELRHVNNDLAVLDIGMAGNNRRRKKDSDEWEDIPVYVDCTLFGKRAEGLEPYLKKGAKVAIDGRLNWSQWETDEGAKRSKLEIIVEEIDFMAPRKEVDE